MDPITQGVLGAALPQATATAHKGAVALAGIFGFFAGMAADLDVLIRSSADPLLFLEYHRQFTHSLIFIPLGGLLSAGVLQILIGRFGPRWRLPFSKVFLFCTLGYGTHGLLDFTTSYGTMLFWPFSEARYSASIISVVDPLMTLPILLLVIVAARKQSPVYARCALAWAGFYLTLGFIQHNAARDMAEGIAAGRGHQVERLTVKPSFGNILVWKAVYQTKDRFYVDAVRVGIAPRVYRGVSIARLNAARDFPWLKPGSQEYRDLARFDRISQGYLARNPDAPNAVIDVRYSFLPNTIGALWSIQFTPGAGPDRHVRFQTNRRNTRENMATLWRLITGPSI
jgi:inner membrane protein